MHVEREAEDTQAILEERVAERRREPGRGPEVGRGGELGRGEGRCETRLPQQTEADPLVEDVVLAADVERRFQHARAVPCGGDVEHDLVGRRGGEFLAVEVVAAVRERQVAEHAADSAFFRPADEAEVVQTERHLQTVVEEARLGAQVERQAPAADAVEVDVARVETVHYVLELDAAAEIREVHARHVGIDRAPQVGAPLPVVEIDVHAVDVHRGMRQSEQSLGAESDRHLLREDADREGEAHGHFEVVVRVDVGAFQIVLPRFEPLEQREEVFREGDRALRAQVQTERPEVAARIAAEAEKVLAHVDLKVVVAAHAAQELPVADRAVEKGHQPVAVGCGVEEVAHGQEVGVGLHAHVAHAGDGRVAPLRHECGIEVEPLHGALHEVGGFHLSRRPYSSREECGGEQERMRNETFHCRMLFFGSVLFCDFVQVDRDAALQVQLQMARDVLFVAQSGVGTYGLAGQGEAYVVHGLEQVQVALLRQEADLHLRAAVLPVAFGVVAADGVEHLGAYALDRAARGAVEEFDRDVQVDRQGGAGVHDQQNVLGAEVVLQQIVERAQAIEDATKEAAIVPMQVAEEIASVMETVIYVAHKGNRNAVTDACVAMMTARTCVLGALLNVRINLASIKDEAFVKQMKVKADHLESEAIRIETKLLDWVKTIV